MTKQEKVIVLAGNAAYTEQLAVTIKSIFYHNTGIKVYVLNRDIMPDWFRKPRQLARLLGGDVIDVKLDARDMDEAWWTHDHISTEAYARYFIPKYIPEDRVVYLDSDLLVMRNLDDMFAMDLQGQPVAAVLDTDGQNFNSGVLIIDNHKWREENITQSLVDETNRLLDAAQQGEIPEFNGDQTIFNHVFSGRWLPLHKRFNLQVGHDVTAFISQWWGYFDDSEKPYIAHFVSYRKPWTMLSANRYRDLWWEFYDADYSQIAAHHTQDFEIGKNKPETLDFLTVTRSDYLEGIENLVQAFPNYLFHIAAYTQMSPALLSLATYANVRLYPEAVPPVVEDLVENVTAYLDINHGDAEEVVLQQVAAAKKPILALKHVAHEPDYSLVFDNPLHLMSAIKAFSQTDEWAVPAVPKNALIMTTTQDIEHIEYLLEALPDVVFHIAAWTTMGPKLMALESYANVQLHPAMNQADYERLLAEQDIYLDINIGQEVDEVMAQLEVLGKPIFGFYTTQHSNHGQYLYSFERPKELVEAVQAYLSDGHLPDRRLPKVRSIDETLDYIIEHEASVIRFGDGEINLMDGLSIPYQDFNPVLAAQLKELVARQSNEKLVVCLPDMFDDRFKFTYWAEDFWQKHLSHYDDFYREIAPSAWYGSTFISRLYIDFEDKSKASAQFDKLKSLWKDKDILIVEGATSRSGVGNDLFDKAKSIKRIVCSSHSAYLRVDEIEDEIMKHADGRVVLLMLGPTAKVLAAKITRRGVRALDIGHIDSEYEWMLMGAKEKVKLDHKHTAEFNFDRDIEFIEDEAYNQQIVADLSGLPEDYK